jgi:hypothetical protein
MNAVFVQNNFIERLSGPLAVVVRERGFDLYDVSLLPDAPLNVDDMKVVWEDYDRVFIYGSVGFLRRCMESGLRKHVSYDVERIAASSWTAAFGDLSLNGSGRVVDVDLVPSLLSAGERLHLRPDNHEKAFTGAVFDQAAWKNIMAERDLDKIEGLKCWVSPVQVIRAEYRCFIVGGEVVEISLYRKDGVAHRERVLDSSIFASVKALCDIHLPFPTIVMDVAEAEDGRLKVIEFNPIHGSGWYAVDIGRVLDAVMTVPTLGFVLEADGTSVDDGRLPKGP